MLGSAVWRAWLCCHKSMPGIAWQVLRWHKMFWVRHCSKQRRLAKVNFPWGRWLKLLLNPASFETTAVLGAAMSIGLLQPEAVHVYTCTYIYLSTSISICIYRYLSIDMYTYIYIHISIYIYIYIHICIYISEGTCSARRSASPDSFDFFSYRDTALIRNRRIPGPFSSPVSRGLGWS